MRRTRHVRSGPVTAWLVHHAIEQLREFGAAGHGQQAGGDVLAPGNMTDHVEEHQFGKARNEGRRSIRRARPFGEDKVEQGGRRLKRFVVRAQHHQVREGIDDQCAERPAKVKKTARKAGGVRGGRRQRLHLGGRQHVSRIRIGTQEMRDVAQHEDAVARIQTQRRLSLDVEEAAAMQDQVETAERVPRGGRLPAAAVLAEVEDRRFQLHAVDQPVCQVIRIDRPFH